MANIIGANFLHRSVTVCCDCAEKRLKADGLVLDEVKEMLGYQSGGFFTRKWNKYPVRYNHSNRVYDGQSYYVWLNDDNQYEYSPTRTSCRLDLSAFTEQDNDKLLYISHDKDGYPVASLKPSEQSYILVESDHYMHDSDYSQLVRVLAHTSLTQTRDIEVITDECNTRGQMLLCDDCQTELVEEMVINCTECKTEIAHGKVAYALEYGDSTIKFNGTPESMRLCLDCYLDAREKIEKKIIAELRKCYDATYTSTYHFPMYAEYAFKLVLDMDFADVYTVEKTRTEQTLTTAQHLEARDNFVTFCEEAFFDVITEELSKNTIMCHDAIEVLTDRYKND